MATDVNAVPLFTTFSEWRKNVHYKEMLEQVAAYNKYLRIERQERLPYLDTQTGVAQSDCFIWRSRHQRRRGCAPGQIFSYPPIRWKVERHHEPQDKPTTKTSATVSTATGNVSQPVEKSSMVTRRAHVTNDYASKKSTAATDLETASIMQSDDSDSVGRGGDNNDASVVYDDSSSSSGDEGHITKRKSTRKVSIDSKKCI